MEFEAITTQEDFDARISERLKREREAVEKNYSDYNELKESRKTFEAEIAENKESLEKLNKSLTEKDNLISTLNAKVQKYESDSVKTRIAREVGLPYELAGRLSGDDEEAIRKDAESLYGFITQPQQTAPLADTEGSIDERAELKSMLDNMKGE